MANNIKGITVEIGGNTGPLTTALKGVNKTAGNLQSELKEVNKQIKFDPSNTVLLKQKQELLAKQISNTKEKLTILKEAERQAEQQFNEGQIGEDKYRALQREVEKTESQLRDLEEQARNTNSILGIQVSAAGEKIKNVGDKISGVGEKLLPVSGAITGIGVAAAKMGSDFEESADKVSTIADTSQVSMTKLKDGVLELSNETGESADDLNEALYQTISAGVKTSDAVGFLGTATKLAKAGFTDSTTAIDTLTTTINAYGLKASDAKNISDKLIQTQNLGKTTVAELGSSLGNVIPMAASLNVNTTDLFGSIAELTKNGLGTSEAITGLKSAMSNILKPTSDASKEAQALGLDFSAAHLKSVGWANFLDEIKTKTGGNSEAMAKLFGSVEGLNAVTVLAGKGSKDFNNILQQMGDTAGTTDSAFKKVENNSATKWEKSMNSMKNAGIKLGESLTPVMDKISSLIAKIAGKLSGLSKDQIDMIVKIGLVVAVVAPLLLTIGKVVTAIGSITVGIGRLITGVGKLHGWLADKIPKAIAFLAANPMILVISAVVAGIVLLIFWIKHLWDTNKNFRNAVITIWNGIKDTIDAIAKWFSGPFVNFFKTAWSDIKSIFSGIGQWFSDVFTTAANGVKSAWNGISGFFSGIWSGIKTVFSTVGSWFSSIFTSAWEGIKSIWSGVTAFFSSIWEGIKTIFSVVGSWFSSIFSDAWNGIKTIWNGVTSFFSSIWSGIKSVFSTVGSWFTGVFKSAYKGITTVFSGLKGFFSGIWSSVSGVFKSGINGLIKGLNILISGMDKIKFTAPDWVPLIGGKSFGIDIPKIPLLATGGIVDRATLAMIGEAGKEAVVPLENNTSWMKQLAEQFVAELKESLPILDTSSQVKTAMAAAYDGSSRTSALAGDETSAGVKVVYHTSVIEKTPVIKFIGDTAQLGRFLTPIVTTEQKRRGATLVKGGNK